MSTNEQHGFRVLPTPPDLPCTPDAPDSWDDRSADDMRDDLLDVIYGNNDAEWIKAARRTLARMDRAGGPTPSLARAETLARYIVAAYDARGDA